ncbi:D-alanyl-D-alanine carboxypeptidase/D-alanyl-D-alanine-endopeptidase [Candidatus Persebacteraceae bacterium Df01]|uniref:D-alanyl-D-alanine carboxypeptidase/D-alanyl-D-alanine-endopeptidase n=1 Tax=Candidatus Doriopsillibacter californiensis TaxID=2970740 RepID=A0ABT7QN62_9GAMM|nr:D-alanyl-D-alanine carboxypeptidase/D-alanyl-D-alanine-endopeptidase [Candidatus Persebacteraceae bacterium Df01]
MIIFSRLFYCRLLLGLLALTVFSVNAAPLPRDIQQLAKKHRIRTDKIGIVIQRVGDDKPLLSYQAEKAFNPASAVKIFTTVAAIDLLGHAHRWETTFAHTGAIKDGILQGDLYLIGSGDPQITLENFFLLLHDLRNRGLHTINGQLVIDNTFFNLPPHIASAFDGAPLKSYNAGAGALAVNFNAQQIVLQPQEKKIHVYVDPPNDNIVIDNQLRPGKGRCSSWRNKIRERYLGNETRITVSLKGIFPPRCGQQSFYISALSHEANAAGVFGALWKQLGGKWNGQWRIEKVPPTAVTLTVFESPPLSQAITSMNKFSNNVIARNLFLSLADSNTSRTLATAREAFHQWAAERGISGGGFFVDNGSGLSRQTRVQPAQIAILLQYLWAHPLRAEMIASLPVLGIDGTLRKRLKKLPMQGHLKTGSLAAVKSIAGFLRDEAGQDILFICLTEEQNNNQAKQFQDSLMKWARRQP